MRAFCPHCGRRFNTRKGEHHACPQHRYALEEQFDAFRERIIAQGGTWYDAPEPEQNVPLKPEPRPETLESHWPQWRLRAAEIRNERREQKLQSRLKKS